ncbi:hypothetical protein HanXRQr2_Chr12g0521851 [Helianthus annuus]|uniref:Uncharacterized protein n=1 Tax=Helianthus annuus TaxID=4232 RepID=A0A9K3EMV8_HELAN|nr:hypothetical protein HanXRQr2_Chr12g0521851 [Helianthus annuus]
MKPVKAKRRKRMPMMRTGQRSQRMHSLSGLEDSQMPAVMMGMEHRMAMKLSVAIMLLLTAMGCLVWL